MKKTLLAMSLLALSGSVQADFLGIYVGGGLYHSKFTGDFVDERSSSSADIDLEDDLDLGSEQNGYAFAAFEHPVPLIPNIRLGMSKLSHEGEQLLSDAIEFDGNTYAQGTRVTSRLDLSYTEGTLYYEVLDNWVEIDLGLTVRRFDGEIELQGSVDGQSESATRELSFTLPMLHGKGQFNLPLTGLSATLRGDVISYRGNRLSDLSLFLGYETSLGLGVEAGVRNFTAKIDDQDAISGDIGYTGYFVGLTFHL